MSDALARIFTPFNCPWSPIQRRFERQHYPKKVSKILRELLQSRKLITKSVKLFNRRVDLEEAFKWDRDKVWSRAPRMTEDC